eukprot:gene8640-9572_t
MQIFDVPEKFDEQGRTVILKGVDHIVNEIGQIIADLTGDETEINLYDAYVKGTLQDAGKILQEDRSEEIKKSMLVCIKEESEMTPEEKELCETE